MADYASSGGTLNLTRSQYLPTNRTYLLTICEFVCNFFSIQFLGFFGVNGCDFYIFKAFSGDFIITFYTSFYNVHYVYDVYNKNK